MMLYTAQTEKLYGNEDDPDREDRHRVVQLPSGNKVHLRAEDPFGFVRVNFEKGNTPVSLSGQYTSYDEARKALDSFLVARENKIQHDILTQRQPKVKLTPRIKEPEPETS